MIYAVLVAIILYVLYQLALSWKTRPIPPPSAVRSIPPIEVPLSIEFVEAKKADHPRSSEDEIFERDLREAARKNLLEIDGFFFSRIAGVTHRNADGTDRQKVVALLNPRDRLQLQPEPTNRYDPNAIAVVHEKYGMAGYLTQNVAAQLNRDFRKATWIALVREIRSAHGDGPLGVVIALAKLRSTPTDSKARKQ
jgi:hypothetical protein